MSGSRYNKWEKDDAISRKLANLLKDAVSRKHKKLSIETVYSHEIILNWLQDILPVWEIHIPESGVSALSEWPKNGKCRNSVKQWLQDQNHGNPDDLIDGLVNHWRIISAPKCLKPFGQFVIFVDNMK